MSNYKKTVWKDSPETEITAERLNNMENGIETAHKLINDLETDFVVEQGTDGIWTYRKWNSGIAECWGIAKIQSLNCGSNHYSGFYYSDGTKVPFPEGLFSEYPCVVFDGGSTDYINFPRDFGSSATDAYFLVAGLISGMFNVSIRIQAKGRWK